MPKVTEKLRKTWAEQRAQMVEEREYTQSGRRRSDDDVLLVDKDVAVSDYLLSLPVGAMFDVQEIYQQLEQET